MGYLQVPLLGALIGALMLFAVLMRWLGLLSRSREKFVDYNSGKGTVGISTRAIRDFVERVGSDFAAVKGIESRLSPSRKGIDLSLKVKVQAGTRIPELSELMQQQLRKWLPPQHRTALQPFVLTKVQHGSCFLPTNQGVLLQNRSNQRSCHLT